MTEKRFVCIDIGYGDGWYITDNGERLSEMEIVDLLNEQLSIIRRDEISINTMMSNMKKLEEEKEYWKSKAMTLLLQVRRLTPRMAYMKTVREVDNAIEEADKVLEDDK